jgi:hypothetical protein
MRQFRDILQYRQVRRRRRVDRVSLSLEPRLQSPALVGALAACRGTKAGGASARLFLDATPALRIPTKSAGDSGLKSATHSD